jgi:ABC-2 type transport system permease protein
MSSFLFSAAIRDFLRPKRIAVWLIVIAALVGITIALQITPLGDNDSELYARMSTLIVFRVLALAAAIFSTAIVAAEVEQKTIVYLLTRPIPRWKILLFRTLASMVVVAILGVLTAVAVSFASMGSHGLSNEALMGDLKAILIGSAAYVSFFTLLTLWINRSMIMMLIYAFGVETIVPNIPGDLRYASIMAHMDAISNKPAVAATDAATAATQGAFASTLTASQSWPILVGITLSTLAIGAWWFTTFEFLPREDVE